MEDREYIIGIDEVGRGPIAGPLGLGAVVLYQSFETLPLIDVPLRDSKKLSEKQRLLWYKHVMQLKKDGLLDYTVAFISAELIDKKGISWALRFGIESVLKKLQIDPVKSSIYLDGGLKAPTIYIQQETIIKGDEKIPVISLASIMAKVMRDQRMKKYEIEFPEYGFAKHKGYGTKAHYEALKKHGPASIHRKTFLA